MLIILSIVLLVAFISLLFRFRRSNVIYYLAAASWVSAYFGRRMILQNCTGDCGVRVDLVVIVSVLMLTNGFAIVALWKRG